MIKLTFKSALALTASAAMLSAYGAETVHAQDGPVVEDEIITIGTRRKDARSAKDVVAPVDIIPATELLNQAPNDIADALRISVPSYNVNTQPISDAATIIRPANLRGLSPDNTLVLVNGKRRHRASVISFLGGGIADGAHGPDISVFPALALKNVQVLRDGASSQYGSDAIAGVINFELKDTAGGIVEARYGQTYEGDGENYRIGANYGIEFGEGGFINVTGEYGEVRDTNRSIARDDAAALLAAGNTNVIDQSVNTLTTDIDSVQIWGQPNINDDIKVFVNTGYEISENLEVYAFGNYAERQAEGGFFFRNPTNRGGVYAGPLVNVANGNAVCLSYLNPMTNALECNSELGTDYQEIIFTPNGDGSFLRTPSGVTLAPGQFGSSIRVGNLNGLDPRDCPAGIPLDGLLPQNGTALATVTGDGVEGNCFSFIESLPGGFVPRFGGDNQDMSIVGGIRGELDIGNGLGYDVSASYGNNQTDFFINNTINASLGPLTPRNFTPGSYEQTDTNFNLGLTYALPISGWDGDLNIAGGFEYREEEFGITRGDDASFAIGPLAAPTAAFPTGQGFSSSSNGFGGFVPAAEGAFAQDNIAIYGELEADVTEGLTVQGALRWEDYSSFGDTLDWKIGGKFDIGDNLTLRSTLSTGFHAPTAGQANVINITTAFVGGVLSDVGTIPITTGAGQFINERRLVNGDDPFTLGPEESNNFTVGLAANLGGVDLTVDYFNISLDGRIATTSNLDFQGELRAFAAENNVNVGGLSSTSEILNALDGTMFTDSAGNMQTFSISDFAGSEDLASFVVFTNNFDTRTQGVDVVASYPFDIGEGSTSITAAANWTDTEVTDRGRFVDIGDLRTRSLEENIPSWKGNVTLNHEQGPLRGLVRANFHSDYFEDHLGTNGFPIELGGEVNFDAEVTYSFLEGAEISVGASNIFNNFPDELADIPLGGFSSVGAVAGPAYPSTAPFGFNGGQWYARARYTF